jgi:hypothetical protein
VFLFDLIGSDFAQQQSLNAIYFVRPSDKNIKLICKHLNPADHPPAFGQYYLFFCNHLTRSTEKDLPDQHVQELAQADQHELVQLVEECAAAPNINTAFPY